MNAVFECIAKWETAYDFSYGSPILRSTILKRTGLNLYQYRKQIKELKDNDLIKYVRHIQRVYSSLFYFYLIALKGSFSRYKRF